MRGNIPALKTVGRRQRLLGIRVIILAVVSGGIIFIESVSLLREIRRLKHNYKHLKRRLES